MPDPAPSRWVPANIPCTVCGSSESDHEHTARYPGLDRPFEMRRCRGCGLLFNSPRVEDLARLYGSDYYIFHETETARYNNAFAEVKRHLDPALAPPPPPCDVLEVGCCKGHLLHLLRHLGYRVHGVEIAPEAAAVAREKFGIDAEVGTVEQYAARSPTPQHDVVWCNDVIEHVGDPRRFLRACTKVLRPGGRLVLDTPNAGSVNVTRGDVHWGGFCPYHVFLFDAQTLPRLCREVGLTVVRVFTYNNVRTPPPTLGQRLHAAARAIARPIGLWDLAKRVKASVSDLDGPLAHRPMTPPEIDARLAALPWYSESPDARSDISECLKGDNLVVHATQT